MDRMVSLLKFVSSLLLTFFLLFLPFSVSYAKAGCCSRHGGVTSCDTATSQLKCKDGSIAGKSCPCKKTAAGKGCCSRHGGVTGCNPQTGQLKCKDGTDAGKTCMCPGSTKS